MRDLIDIKNIILWCAKYTGMFSLCRWLTRNQVRILAYHGIWLGEGHFGNFLYMSASKFSERMNKIKKMGFPVLSLDQALDSLNKKVAHSCPVVITIDDGWYSSYLYMLPELEKYDFPATLYLTTYYSGKREPVYNVLIQYMIRTTEKNSLDLEEIGMAQEKVIDLSDESEKARALVKLQLYVDNLSAESRSNFVGRIAKSLNVDYQKIIEEKWFHLASFDQVKDMVKRGIDVQLHTHRHRISENGVGCLEQELAENRFWLKSIVKQPLKHFCYPSGVYDKTVWPVLKDNEIVSATTTETGFADSQSHVYALPRILDGEEITDIEFEAELSGVGEVKRRLIGFFGRANHK